MAATFSINCCFVILFEFNGFYGEAFRPYSPRQREQTQPARLSSNWKAFLGGTVGRAMAAWPKMWRQLTPAVGAAGRRTLIARLGNEPNNRAVCHSQPIQKRTTQGEHTSPAVAFIASVAVWRKPAAPVLPPGLRVRQAPCRYFGGRKNSEAKRSTSPAQTGRQFRRR